MSPSNNNHNQMKSYDVRDSLSIIREDMMCGQLAVFNE